MKASHCKKVKKWVDTITTDDGYQFYVYVFEDGTYQDNLNDDLVDLSGVADDVKVVVVDAE